MKVTKLLGAACAALAISSFSQAQIAPTDTVSIVVPYGPGGGFDRAVRALAPYLSQELGGANVITENIPGAGGQRGSTAVYRANPDGKMLGIFNLPGFALPAILGESVGYDLEQLSWVGRLENQDYVLLVSASSNIHTLDDVIAQSDVVITSTGYGSTVLAALQITAAALGMEEKDPIYLSGYPGTTDAMVGVIRGDGWLTMAPTTSAMPYLQSGDLRAIAVSGAVSAVEGVPTFGELGYPELTPLNLQRAIAGPPNMDEATLTQLRDAFARVLENPGFLSYAREIGLDVAFLNGEDTAAEVGIAFEFYEKFSTSLGNPN